MRSRSRARGSARREATWAVLLLAAAVSVAFGACASEAPTPAPVPTSVVPSTTPGQPSSGASSGFVGGPTPNAIVTAGEPTVEPSASATPTPTTPPLPGATPVSLEPGLGWSAATTTGLDGVELRGVIVTAAGWLAVGRSTDAVAPPAWTSTDGAAWTRSAWAATGPAGAVMYAVLAGGPGYVSVGTLPSTTTDGTPTTVGAIFTSSDGITWSQAGDLKAGNDSELRGLASVGDRLVAVGRVTRVGAAAWTSTDGASWNRSTKGFRSEPLTVMYGVVAGGPGVVAVGQGAMGGAAWTSPDGVHWRREPDSPQLHRGALRSVVRVDGGLVAVGDNAWISKDGIHWTSVVEPSLQTPELWAAIATADGITAVGNDRHGDGAAWHSVDGGRSWRTASAQPELLGASLFGLTSAADTSGVVAVGGAGGSGILRWTPPGTP